MISLNERLTNLRDEKKAARDPAITAVLDRSTEALRASGRHDEARGVGDLAPMFARPNVDGQTVRMRSLLADGPVVVSFFRGRW